MGLLLGLWTLLAPEEWGTKLLKRSASTLCLLCVFWLLACYVASAVAPVVDLPEALAAFGIQQYRAPPSVLLQFLLHLLPCVVLATVARNQAAAVSGRWVTHTLLSPCCPTGHFGSYIPLFHHG